MYQIKSLNPTSAFTRHVCVGDVWLEAATSFPTFGLVNIIHISQIEKVTEVLQEVKQKGLIFYQIL